MGQVYSFPSFDQDNWEEIKTFHFPSEGQSFEHTWGREDVCVQGGHWRVLSEETRPWPPVDKVHPWTAGPLASVSTGTAPAAVS